MLSLPDEFSMGAGNYYFINAACLYIWIEGFKGSQFTSSYKNLCQRESKLINSKCFQLNSEKIHN
jgi:hypothetical protein